MYGQKQILQCLFVAFLVTILNFYRSAIRRDREIQKYVKERIINNLKTTEDEIKLNLPVAKDDKEYIQLEKLNGLEKNEICEFLPNSIYLKNHFSNDENQCHAFNFSLSSKLSERNKNELYKLRLRQTNSN